MYKSSDVVVIVPFLCEDALLMIRQYRYPLRKGYIAKKIQHFYTYHQSISKSRQLVHIFRAKDLVEDKSNHDGTEDITRLEIVSVEQLKHLIKVRKIESTGTLIAYLVCCTGIVI
jgi:ADP-ribose pyrophosphatase